MLQGDGVRIGVIDSGINPENPSFADIGGDGYDHVNPKGRFYGVCDPSQADYDATFPCNDKLIGVYEFLDAQADRTDMRFGVLRFGTYQRPPAAQAHTARFDNLDLVFLA